MNLKKLSAALVLEGILCVALVYFLPGGSSGLPGLMAFPFSQIGQGLRWLSLSGAAGNGLAVALYAALSLLPAGWLAARYLRKKLLHWEDGLLALLSALLFFVLYRMVNPGGIGAMFGAAELTGLGKGMLGGTVWSAVAAYLVLRALRAFAGGGGTLLRWLDWLMAALCALLVWAALWGGIGAALSGAAGLEAGNTEVPWMSYLFVALLAVVDVLPHCLMVRVLMGAFPLTAALARDPYGPEVSALARRLAGRCRTSVTAVVLAQLGVNLLQLLCAGELRSSSYQVSLPLFDLAAVLVVLLLADYLARSRALKEENDSFV